jgi:tripartite-type tricarboxylate transporter receptor subunit TctC
LQNAVTDMIHSSASHRRRNALLTAATILLLTCPGPSVAQNEPLPSHIKVVVPFAAGGGSDVIARAMAKQLAQRLGSSVIVENRPGAGGLIGAAAVARGPKDGSVLLFHSTSLVTAAATAKKPSFEVSELIPLAIVAEGPMLVGVSHTSGIKTPQELVAAAKSKPDGISYGSPGIGSIGHLGVELLNDAAKIHLRHIPYSGSAPALVDVAAGRVDLTIGSYSALSSQIVSGRVIPIAVTSAHVNPTYPKLPPLASAAPGYEANIWYAIFAPAGLAPGLLQHLHREAVEAARSSEVQALVKPDGALPVAGSLDELSRRVRQDYATWKKLATHKLISVD